VACEFSDDATASVFMHDSIPPEDHQLMIAIDAGHSMHVDVPDLMSSKRMTVIYLQWYE
jgi:hypothetical protein